VEPPSPKWFAPEEEPARLNNAVQPARLTVAAGIVVWLGASVILWSLSSHVSRSGTLLGRYSRGYALLLVVGLLAVVTFGLTLIWPRRQWPRAAEAWLRRVPLSLLPVLIALGTPTLAWLLRLGSSRYAFLSQPLFQIGSAVVHGGLALLLYSAWQNGGAANPVWADRQLAITRTVLISLLFTGAAGLFLPAVGLRLSAPKYWALLLMGFLAIVVGVEAARRAWAVPEVRERIRAAWVSLYRFQTLVAGVLIVAYIFVTYRPGLQQALLGGDELLLLSIVYGRSPWIGFLGPLPKFGSLFRPLFALQAWVLYTVFGPNFSAYYVFQLAHLVLSCLLIVYCALAIGGSFKVALLTALLFSSHVFVSDQISRWAFDVAPLTGLIAIAVAALLWRWPSRWYAYLALLVLLFLAALSRENGLAVIAATGLYAVFAVVVKHWRRPQALAVLLVCVGAALLYFVPRTIILSGVPIDPTANVERTAVLYRIYSVQEIQVLLPAQRLGLYAYTALANLISYFIPVFGQVGELWSGNVGVWVIVPVVMGSLTALIGLTPPVTQNWSTWSSLRRRRILFALTLVVAGLGLAVFAIADSTDLQVADPTTLAALQFAIQLGLSLGILYASLRGRAWSPAHRAMAGFALGLIVAGSLVAFPYFRYRTHYIGYFGWLLLLVIVLYYLRAGRWRTSLRRAMLISATALVVINAARVNTSLPLPYLLPANFTYRGMICAPALPAAVAEAIAERYQLDQKALDACRAANAS
jgi:hypothetical protein